MTLKKPMLILLSSALLTAGLPRSAWSQEAPESATRAEAQRYAEREAKCGTLAEYRGGFHGVAIVAVIVAAIVVVILVAADHHNHHHHVCREAPDKMNDSPRPYGLP